MKKRQSINRFVLIGIFGTVLVAGLFLFRSLVTFPSVSEITSLETCISNIATYTATDSCGEGWVKRVDYTCTTDNKKGYEGGSSSDCIDPIVAYNHAQIFCGQTCTTPPPPRSPFPTPTPTPSTKSPKPTATTTPTPIPSPKPYETISPTSTQTPASCRNIRFFGWQICNGRLIRPTSIAR